MSDKLTKDEKRRIETMKAIANVTAGDKMAERIIKGYIEFLEMKIESQRLGSEDFARMVNEVYDGIWAAVGDGKGEWDYPTQIIRFAEYLKQENKTNFEQKIYFANKLNDLVAEVEAAKLAKG